MANRTLYVGDTYPDCEFQVSDETGVLNLQTDSSPPTVIFAGTSHRFSGPGAAIQPPIADADGVHHWNLRYSFASGDTAQADTYNVFVKRTVSTGPPIQYETFPTGDTLTVLPAP